jgi:hypothetical protein
MHFDSFLITKGDHVMARLLRRVLALGVLLAAVPLVSAAQDEVANPYYKSWAKFKPGATVVFKETTKLSGPAAASAPEGTDVKVVTYKLTEVNADKVVVETRVLQHETFGYVETAPTRHIYPAKMNKAVLEDYLEDLGVKGVVATLKVGDKELKVMVLTGTHKKGDEVIEAKIWLSDEVPGGIVKRISTTKINNEVVAVTNVELLSHKQAAMPAPNGK